MEAKLPAKKVIRETPLDVDTYIADMPKEIRGTLAELRAVIKKAAPKATENISYGMPFYEYGGSGFKGRLIYFSASKKYVAIYFAPTRAGGSLDKLKKYEATKSSFHFPLDEPLPLSLINETLREIVKKIDRKAKSEPT